MFRWVPGNQARTRTEPAPSELLKATRMLPVTRRVEPATGQTRIWINKAQGKVASFLFTDFSHSDRGTGPATLVEIRTRCIAPFVHLWLCFYWQFFPSKGLRVDW